MSLAEKIARLDTQIAAVEYILRIGGEMNELVEGYKLNYDIETATGRERLKNERERLLALYEELLKQKNLLLQKELNEAKSKSSSAGSEWLL